MRPNRQSTLDTHEKVHALEAALTLIGIAWFVNLNLR